MTFTNSPARAYTAGELVKLRSQKTSIFTARINQGSFTYPVDELTYDGSSGTYTDVKAGMFAWVGTGAGLKDKGMARVRTTADGSKIYINPIADGGIAFADNDYITIYSNPRQASKLGLVIQHPATVYTARINQTFSTLDEVIELTYDGGTGTLADVKEGMTVYIGSQAGARDKGETRVRKTPTSTILYIPPTSGIAFADNDFITIVDAFFFASRPIYNKSGVIRMDTDIEVGATDRGGIIPRLAPIAAVIEQTSGTLTFTPPNPSLSACYDGNTISSYQFAAPGADTTSNMTSATTASWTYPLTADQQYRWSCAITDSLSRVTTSYRRVFINPTEIPFEVGRIQGDYDSGDWSFDVTVYDDPGTIYDHALAVLYVRDYRGKSIECIGKLQGYENIIATGWIDGETIEQDANTGQVSFTVRGAAFWMDKIQIDPLEMGYVFDTPTAWGQVEGMTVDMILNQMVYWMSNVTLFMDVFFTSDTNRVRAHSISAGSLLAQIRDISGKIFAAPAVNNYGQMFIQIDQQFADSTARATFPVVLDITTADYEEPLEIEYNRHEKTAMLQLGAYQDADGVADIMIYSRAPGNAPFALGNLSTYDDYIIADADECRRLSGALLANENNQYQPIQIDFPASVRLFDIAPRMVATITTDGGDNPRSIALTSQRLVPRTVTYIFDDTAPKTQVTFEIETTGTDGVDYYPPTAEDDNLDTGLADLGDFNLDMPALDDLFGDLVPPDVDTPCDREIGNNFTISFSPRVLTGSTSSRIARAYFPCTIRATGGTHGTYLQIQYTVNGDAETHKACYAVDGDTRVLTGSWSGNVVTFSPVSDTEVTGFEIELDAGVGATISRWALGKLIETGDMGTATTACVIDEYYAIEAYTGYWSATFPAEVVNLAFYNTYLLPGNSLYRQGVGRDGFGDFHLYPWGDHVERGRDATEVFNPYSQSFEMGGNYGRIYFQSGTYYGAGGQASLCASWTTTLGGSYGNMRWALYEAQAIGRQLLIGYATLHNVCTVD